MASIRTMLPVVRRHLATVDSTNTYVSLHAGSFDPAALTVVTTDEQTAGRGRSDRVWLSSGLDLKATFAFVVPAHGTATAYQLSPLLALVTTRALAEFGVDAQIKWPNDLIVSQDKKCGGILCELVHVPPTFFAALGVGINVNSLSTEISLERPIWPISTLKSEYGKEFDLRKLTDTLVTKFNEALPVFLESGFAPFHAEYESKSVLLGKTVKFRDGVAEETGRVVALGLDGKLYIDLGEGGVKGYLSGEVSALELVAGSGTYVSGHPDGK